VPAFTAGVYHGVGTVFCTTPDAHEIEHRRKG